MTDTPKPATPEPQAKRPLDVRWLLQMSAIVIILGAFVAFAMQNSETIEVEFLWWSFEAPQIILLVGSAIAGIAIWELGGFVRRRRNKDR